MNNEELHEQAFDLAVKLAPHCDKDELSLLCYLFGIGSKDVVAALEAPKHTHPILDTDDGSCEACAG